MRAFLGLSLISLDILKVMQDLEETSNHSVDILKHFVVSPLLAAPNSTNSNVLPFYLLQPELCRIIQDPDPSCCKLAHNLLLRHLKQMPRYVCACTMYVALYNASHCNHVCYVFFTVLLMRYCRRSLVAWSHMTTVWCQLLLPASLTLSYFAKVV